MEILKNAWYDLAWGLVVPRDVQPVFITGEKIDLRQPAGVTISARNYSLLPPRILGT